MEQPMYDQTVRAATRNSDPERQLYDAIADREGWAWQNGRALHLATDREVVVDLTGPPPSPYRVILTPGEKPWWHHDVATAVRQVEMHGEPRYTLDEARRLEAKQRCAEDGHRLRVQHGSDGSPESVVCDRGCQGWWAVSQDHLAYVLDALRAAVEFAGPDALPFGPGSPWYDALANYWPEDVARLLDEAEAKARRIAELTDGAQHVVKLDAHRREYVGAVPTTPEVRVDAPTVPALSVVSTVDGPTAVIPVPRPAADDLDGEEETRPLRRPALVPLTGGAAQPPTAG